jgi:hypothetical protein
MKHTYLEVTFRKGKPLAAYLYLPRQPGDRSARVEPAGPGLNVDYTADGRAIGVEILSPKAASLESLNAVLQKVHAAALDAADLAPLAVA